MKPWKRCVALIAAAFLFVTAGCAVVTPKKITICEMRQCAVIKDTDPKEDLLLKLYNLFQSNLNRDLTLYETEPGAIVNAAEKDSYFDKGFSFYVQGGPMPGVATVKTVRFTDIVYIDREALEIKLKVKPRGTWNVTPLWFAEAEAVLKIKSAREIHYESTYLLTWMIVGTSLWAHDWMIDYIDLDRKVLGGYYAIKGAGPLTLGGGTGYMQISFEEALPLEKPAGAVVAGVEKKEPVESKAAAEAVPEETSKEAPPELAYKVSVIDASGDNIFDGGEEVSLKVEVENKGKGEAQDVQVSLSGNDNVARYFDGKRYLGNMQAGHKKTAEFKAALPLNVSAATGELTVRVREGRGFSPAESRTLKIAMRPGTVTEKVEVISAIPNLVFSTKLTDQNNNRVLNAGEEITLQVDVENKGEGPATDVQVLLSGHPMLIGLLGSAKALGNINVGERKTALFRAILPHQIASETATVRIEIREGQGFAPPERKVLQVAMKSAEVKDVVEVISEVNVDDIPARIKGFENKDDYAVLFGISKYREESIPEVKYASRDADVMAKYLERLSGIPKANIMVLTDEKATKSDLEAYLEDWLSRRVTKKSRVFVYYAGHGAPDPQGRDAYIVPYEGNPDFPSKLYPVSRMYAALDKLPAREVIVILDSCFSGAEGRSVTSKGTRPLVITMEDKIAKEGNIAVLAASEGNQISSDYDKVRHGLFTYYLLRGLRGDADVDKTGYVDLGSLYRFVKTKVEEKASLEFNRDQTPVLLPSGPEAAGVKMDTLIARTR
ncbi:MAG: caspase family protein [Deltaproteobacteria bacterium]|nr:caspase family protein [Deltaproteobacteria bacterium]